jgi:hypothetical protein
MAKRVLHTKQAIDGVEEIANRYPTGFIDGVGENLRNLTSQRFLYTPPLRTSVKTPSLHCLVIPTVRSVINNRKNIQRILQLARVHQVPHVLFLCSQKAKRTGIAQIAANFSDVSWIAIDGPFLPGPLSDFKTSKVPIADYGERDLAQKRNFALLLARVMGWDTILLLDDDIEISDYELLKAADLLQSSSQVVGFSAEDYPDHSVAMHAGRWINACIDSFIGGGALAIKTSDNYFSFFPQIYNDDWLFLLPYCMLEDGVTWAGAIKQKRYNPFDSTKRARSQEPGDLLAEGLMRLAIEVKQSQSPPQTLDATMSAISQRANKNFWEHEINRRILFLHNLEQTVKRHKHFAWKKRAVLASLSVSLEVLNGKGDWRGIEAERLATWTKHWVADVHSWNELLHKLPRCQTLQAALEYLVVNTSYTYNVAVQPAATIVADRESIALPAELKGLPQIVRSADRLRGLHSTSIIEAFHRSKGLGLRAIANSAQQLRFDRPTEWKREPPALTIGMLLAAGEPFDQIDASIQAIITWLPANTQAQIVLWVYAAKGDGTRRRHVQYRNSLVAQLLPEIVGSNVRLRSTLITRRSVNIDRLIDDALVDVAMAYWHEQIEGDHQVFVVNSRNELLRKGTFWEFLQHEHVIPGKTLQSYLQKGSFAKTIGPSMDLGDDNKSLLQSRRNLTHESVGHWWKTLFRYSSTKALLRSMKKANLSWLALDDVAYEIKYVGKPDQQWRPVPRTVCYIPIAFDPQKMTAHVAKHITETVSLQKTAINKEWMIVVHAGPEYSWQQVLDFRQELMRLVEDECQGLDLVLGSLVLHPDTASTLAQARLVAIAAVRYAHWILDHGQRPAIHLLQQ